jgi:hypothetical protein
MTDSGMLARWHDDEQALAAIGAALYVQDTTCHVRLPSGLADVAIAAWKRTDEGDLAEDEDREHEVVRERAAALALLGAQLVGNPMNALGEVEARLDAWYIGVALGAADAFDLLGPEPPSIPAPATATFDPTFGPTFDTDPRLDPAPSTAPSAPPEAAPAADETVGFSLWLEFEHVAEPVADFCNIGVTTSDGRAHGLNVWTFDFVQALASGETHDDTGQLAVGYVTTPDLLVRELTRSQITGAVTHLLANGGLPAASALPPD